MADFTGMTVSLTLKEPLGLLLQGKVKQIVPRERTLVLENVYFPQSGKSRPSYVVRGSAIEDIQVVNTNPTPTPTAATHSNATAPPKSASNPSAHSTTPAFPTANSWSAGTPSQPAGNLPIRPSGQTQQQPLPFVDPAILSYGGSPLQIKATSRPPEPSTPIKATLAKAAESLPNNRSPFVAEAGKSSSSRKASTSKEVKQQEAGARHSVTVQTQSLHADGIQEVVLVDTTKKKAQKTQKKKKPANINQAAEAPLPVMNVDVSRNGNDMNGKVERGKGWRQTPLLQPSPQTASPPGISNARKSRKQREETNETPQNGWATGDASEIQELGDFDFEANHKLFDKKQVFDQLRQDDATADEDRLVTHNKVHRPGTYGGKNLHPMENVLSPQLRPHNGNELDSTSDADTELNFANGPSSSRHSTTRVSLKKQPSRQNSSQVDLRPHPLSASMSSDYPRNRSVTSLSGRPPTKKMSSIGNSPLPDRARSPHSAGSTKRSHPTPIVRSRSPMNPHFTIYPHTEACPVLLPHALETLEKATVARYGLSDDAITESAARCIAEEALRIPNSPAGSRRGSRANTLRSGTNVGLGIDRPSSPVIVIIAGNHAVGARAVAAARHLVCRRFNIIVAEAQYESADTQDVQMKTQIAMLKRMAKAGATIRRGPWRRASRFIKNLAGPPVVIIDALLGGATYRSLLDSANSARASETQMEAREMIDWANRSRAPVLSVACPSGVSGTDGSTTTVEGEPLAVRPGKLLCLGAPMQGILEAMKGGETWDISLADIGINIALKSGEAVAFETSWVAELRFSDGDTQHIASQEL